MLILLFAVSVISFALVELSPIDTVSSYVGENAVSQELRDSIAEKWGLNDPPVTRYFRWLGNILKGDMGTSITYRRPVIQIITERFKMSLILMGLAWILSGVVGFLLGVLSAAYEGSWLDRLIKVYCLLIQSSPVFWLAMVVLLVFAVALNLCSAGLSTLGIDSVGNVRGCESLYDERFIEGNLRQRSLREIWEDESAFSYNRRFEPRMLTGKCASCEMGEYCGGGCRSYNFFAGGKLYESPLCPRQS